MTDQKAKIDDSISIDGKVGEVQTENDPYLEKIDFKSFRDADDLETAISVQWHHSMSRSLYLSTVLEQSELAPLFAGAQWAGTRVWHAAIAMIEYLVDNHKDILSSPDSRLLELGCGLGVPGMIVHEIFQTKTYLTDQESIMSQLKKNIQSNFSRSTDIHALPLSWSQEIHPLHEETDFDILINCDCVYEPLYGESWKLLVHELNHVLEKNPKVVVLISVERRNADGIDSFLSELESSPQIKQVERVWNDDDFQIEIYQAHCARL
mmetsp:Transcript_21582/g.31924  ORF Transcript_21582/g.31924 Transcript_21582/m.31924 type:complete len:265 (+) Transcript_21582:104-898(+)